MKKLLVFSWIIIIAGGIIITLHYTKPNPAEIPSAEQELITEIVTEQEVLTPSSSKTFSQYISDGQTLLENGEISQAIQNFQSASILNETSTLPLLHLGNAYLINSDPGSAEAIFKKALLLDRNSTEIKIGIARSYLNNRNIEAAKQLIWQLDEEAPLVKYYKGILYILYKDFDNSKKQFLSLIPPEDEKLKEFFETPEYLTENAQKFLDAYEEFSYFKGGEESHLETLLAKAMTEVYEYDAAIRLLFDVLDQKNNYRDAWIVLGYAYLNTDKAKDAIDAFSQAKSLDEENPNTLFFLGLSHFANNEIDKAVLYIEKADKFGFEPKDQINLKLAELYTLQEEFDQAEKKYEEVLSINTSSIEIFTRIIWLNIDKLGNPEKALSLAYQTLDLYPQSAVSYNLVGWALTAMDNLQEAKKYLGKALLINPNYNAALLNLGWLFEKQGSTTIAKEYYKRAYALSGGNSIANLAAKRFNAITEKEMKNAYIQVNISAPNTPGITR
ncbi:MAG: tetratricopeptide repeat protein [Candidatus Peregrinibacteria bacterium]